MQLPRGITLRAEGRRAARHPRDRRAGARCTAWRAPWWPTPCAASPTGFKKDLDIVGVGYRAELKGKMVIFALGYSHPDRVPDSRGHSDHGGKADAPDRFAAPIAARSARSAADIRGLRPPDPYKQKGIRLTGERLKKKAGKAGRRQDRGRATDGSRRNRRTKERSWQRNRFANFRATRIAERIHRRVRHARRGHARASAAVRVSLARAHLRAGDRRSQRAHAGLGQFDRQGDAHADSRAAATWPPQK